tara:strand:+ start:7478 stop:7696 length:219 start_codon:yes stop_codon:yes gene_type:complete
MIIQIEIPEPIDPLPFTLPLKVVSAYKCGTDAHVMDAEGNTIIASSGWEDGGIRHLEAMQLICKTVNDKILS